MPACRLSGSARAAAATKAGGEFGGAVTGELRQGARRPADSRRIALIGAWICGPWPAAQAVSVAVIRNCCMVRLGGNGGGQRMVHIRVTAAAAASGGMGWRRPRGMAMSWAWTRMSISVSR